MVQFPSDAAETSSFALNTAEIGSNIYFIFLRAAM